MTSPNSIQKLRTSIHQHIVGKDEVIDALLTCLLARGHILLEDVPGVGKTSFASALAQSIKASFQRIQFTSDLLPADIVGVPIFNSEKNAFEFHAGPIFSNIILADEINRTTPKTQSALLEAMQEGQVTVDRESHILAQPFMVIATQNPIEQHGTYPLPESQLDRFLFKIRVGYPNFDDECSIAVQKGRQDKDKNLEPVCSIDEIIQMQTDVSLVKVDESLSKYMVEIVRMTRQIDGVLLGVSPRGTIAIYKACQAYAYLQGRNYVTPDDVKKMAKSCLPHRIHLAATKNEDMTFDQHQQQELMIQMILDDIEVPM